MTIEASCHCGGVVLALAAAPRTVTDCNCSICRRYGVLWAYYPSEAVATRTGAGTTDAYAWKDRSIAFHRCRTCGCVTHWASITRAEDRVGVNARLLPPEVLAAARIRRLDGAGTERYLDE